MWQIKIFRLNSHGTLRIHSSIKSKYKFLIQINFCRSRFPIVQKRKLKENRIFTTDIDGTMRNLNDPFIRVWIDSHYENCNWIEPLDQRDDGLWFSTLWPTCLAARILATEAVVVKECSYGMTNYFILIHKYCLMYAPLSFVLAICGIMKIVCDNLLNFHCICF